MKNRLTPSEHGAMLADCVISFVAYTEIYGPEALRRAHEILSAAFRDAGPGDEEAVFSAACNLIMQRLREESDR
jgi:hypothetical protein